MKFPLLLRPNWLVIRRRLVGEVEFKGQSSRDLILSVFALIISLAIYHGTVWTLRQVNANPALSYLPASSFLGMVFLMLFIMVLISSILTAIGALFTAEDMDLIMASPAGAFRLFLAKYIYVYLVSSWMPFLFVYPLLLAFGNTYDGGIFFYLVSTICLLAWFAIPAAAGLILAVILVLLVPVYRVREMLIILFIGAVGGIYMLIEAVGLQWTASRTAEELLRVVALLSLPNAWWLPSFWIAHAVESLLVSDKTGWEIYAALLWASALALSALSFLVISAFHDTAFSRGKDRRLTRSIESRKVQKLLRTAGNFLSPPFRAILGKEMRIMSRDVTQALQVLLLLGLALVYLYHLRAFSAVESFPESIRPWWKSFMFLGNVCMGSFITTAICTRFVFPSVSIEGRAFWVIQTSPLQIKDLMRIKFWSWLIPVGLVCFVFFISGALVIGAEPSMIAVNAVSSIVVCYGITGLAIGLGAAFAQFEWEHSSQLAAGFGSFIFMLSSIILIFVNMIPGWILLFGREQGTLPPSSAKLIFVGANLFVFLVFNILVAELAMKRGARALESMINR